MLPRHLLVGWKPEIGCLGAADDIRARSEDPGGSRVWTSDNAKVTDYSVLLNIRHPIVSSLFIKI